MNEHADATPAPLSDEAAAAMVEVLQRHRVAFVLIGGFAIQLHGVDGLARTADLDVTPSRTTENLGRLAAALTELDARLRGIGLPDEGLEVPWHQDLLARMDLALNLITKYGPLDISLHPSGTDGYDDLARAAIELPIVGAQLRRRHSPTSSDRRRRLGARRTLWFSLRSHDTCGRAVSAARREHRRTARRRATASEDRLPGEAPTPGANWRQ